MSSSEITGFSTLTSNKRSSLINKTTRRDIDNILTSIESKVLNTGAFLALQKQLTDHLTTFGEDPHHTTELAEMYETVMDLLYTEYLRLNDNPVSREHFEEAFTTKQDIVIDTEEADVDTRQDVPTSVKVLRYLIDLHNNREDVHPNIFDTFEYTTVPMYPVINLLPKMYLGFTPLNGDYIEYVTYTDSSIPITNNTIYISGHMYDDTDSEKSIVKFINDASSFSIEFTQKPENISTLTAYIKNGSDSYEFDVPFNDLDFAFFVVYTPTYIRILRLSGETLVQQNLFTAATFYINSIYIGLPIINRFEYEEMPLFDSITVYPAVLDADEMNLILDTRLI